MSAYIVDIEDPILVCPQTTGVCIPSGRHLDNGRKYAGDWSRCLGCNAPIMNVYVVFNEHTGEAMRGDERWLPFTIIIQEWP